MRCHSSHTPEIRGIEIPSANGHASAKALATVGNKFIQGEIISLKGVEEAQSNLQAKKMFGYNFKFGNAGLCSFDFSTRDGWTGWMGFGGSVMQWHNEESIAFGYAMNCLELHPACARGKRLQQEVLNCLRAMNTTKAPEAVDNQI